MTSKLRPIWHYVTTDENDGRSASCAGCDWKFVADDRDLRGAAIHQHLADVHMDAYNARRDAGS